MTKIFYNDRTMEALMSACEEKYGVIGQLRPDGYVWLYNTENESTENELEEAENETSDYIKSEHLHEDIADLVEEKRKEFILEDLRAERNRLITQTDWWANSDLTMTQEQMDYRQALRDITETYSSLEEVIWPCLLYTSPSPRD